MAQGMPLPELPRSWLVPDWPAPAGVHALFTAREGGVSAPPFDSFNLGDHVRDDPAHVQANRRILHGITGARPVFLRQVHGTHVAELDTRSPDGLEADACLATAPGMACTIMVADCLPVLFTDRQARFVAAAHAGWRGLAGVDGPGVLASTVAAVLARVPGTTAGGLLAWLGPCIGPARFEVGSEVRAAFADAGFDVDAAFRPAPPPGAPGQWLADLPLLARQHLRRLGVTAIHGNDGTPPWCTVQQPSRFFSHRRDAARLGSTGRMAACIWLG